MPLSWNEILERAIKFSHDWKDTTSEKAEAQTFWNEFFHIFGIERRRVAVYEKAVEQLGNKRGSIDLFWKGTLLVEHKSTGQNLDKAEFQALDYFQGLKEDWPRYVIVCDFNKFRLSDYEDNTNYEFYLSELVDHLKLFDFIRGYTKKTYKDEDPVNVEAAELMGKLHDALKENGYSGHPLEMLLVRLMFCFFADDTGIFLPKKQFSYCIETKTEEDGQNTGSVLNHIFEILNTPENKRQINLDEDFKILPYINGLLFSEMFQTPEFNTKTRNILVKCCNFDWSRISPAIFGSMFQSVMNPKMRRNLGAHYTSEKNILKTVNALFLDELWKKFESNKHNKLNLEILLYDIGKIKILDPACGCGTFLVISYRELRRLEIQIHKQLRHLEGIHNEQKVLNVDMFNPDINVNSMYGIEIEEFPARIAQVALWLVDHQVNIELSSEFGFPFVRLPLVVSARICVKNALDIDWETVVPKNEVSYIIGNPPYSGYHLQSDTQKQDMKRVFSGKISGYGKLDYVSAWYQKALEYIKDTNIEVGFVSTNSITQGEQVGILWESLVKDGIRINFAHRTFDWSNQAKGNAAVYVVIIGFAVFDRKKKYLYEYSDPFGEPFEIEAQNINSYLIDAQNFILKSRKTPLSDVPVIKWGCKPVDGKEKEEGGVTQNSGGNLVLSDKERVEYLSKEPKGEKYIVPLASAKEFLHNIPRWCFWLVDASPADFKNLPVLKQKIERVRDFRLASKKEATKKLALTPMLFGEIRQPTSNFILIPIHSSERRRYIPMAYLPPAFIVHNSCAFIEDAKLYHFGVLSSSMHMAWVRQVCGRLESRYRYSNDIVYNNFPWPKALSQKQFQEVTNGVWRVLDIRKAYSDSSLSDLYDPLTMPKRLMDIHATLDRAVERCYRPQPFTNDSERLKFLFQLYEEYTKK